MECKTLHGILLLLTQDEGSCTATEFLTNKLVHQTMEKYGRCMTRINEGILVKYYCRKLLNIIVRYSVGNF